MENTIYYDQSETILRDILRFFNNDINLAKAWMEAENPMLGGITPIQMIKNGKMDRLQDFVDEAMSHNKTYL